MFSLIISVLVGLAAGGLSHLAVGGIGWPIFFFITGFFITLIITFRIFGKKLQAIVEKVQTHQMAAQQDIQKMAQSNRGASQKVMMKKAEKVMAKAIEESLEILKECEPLFKWNLLAKKQVATISMQLNFQVKKFEEVDKLMPQAWLLDVISWCMKMSRQYHKEEFEALEKSYKKGIKKFKKDKGILVYSVYAWTLIKRKEFDAAREVLRLGFENTKNPEIERNWQALANNKPKQFSNHFLGEQWYGLHFEEVKVPKQRVDKSQMRSNPIYGGKRRFR